MKIHEQNTTLFRVCGNVSQFPPESMPEIAFAGKSNVGKSSLINMLLGRKGLAHTSSVPGKTQTVNWYNVDNALFFVDLPGYGYAKAAKKEQDRWSRAIEDYLHRRGTLRGVLLLTDIRHEPGENDKLMLNWLREYQIPTVIAATKSDKLNRSQILKQTSLIAKTLDADPASVIAVSALKGDGRDILWKQLLQLIKM
ncbi:MAG TPA: YihA family ribosome biogenesis GTP-binding protein [Lachnospiraceae bacterium]|nr:YihA family ribosome biogenesis GTP-binding protein [Lachnospiraceae bacterium]